MYRASNFRITFFRALLFLLSANLVGCQGAPRPHGADATIGAEGGTLHGVLEEGITVALQVPGGAVSNDTEFEMKVLTPENAGFDVEDVIGGRIFDLKPDGTRFLTPLRLSVSLPRTSRGSHDVRSRYPSASLYHYNERDRIFEPVRVFERSIDGRTVTYLLDHFSKYFLKDAGVQVTESRLVTPRVPGNTSKVAIKLKFIPTMPTCMLSTAPPSWCTIPDQHTVRAYIKGESALLAQKVVKKSDLTSVPFEVQLPAGNAGESKDLVLMVDNYCIWRQSFITDLLPVPSATAKSLAEVYAPILELAESEKYNPIGLLDFIQKVPFTLRTPHTFGDYARDVEGSKQDTGALWARTHNRFAHKEDSGTESLLTSYGNYWSQVRFETDNKTTSSAIAGLQNKVHARVIYASTTKKEIIITYFMFYAKDEKGIGDFYLGHEGDRESFAIRLECPTLNSCNPKSASFGQHIKGQIMTDLTGTDTASSSTSNRSQLLNWIGDVVTISWDQVNKKQGHPVLYIAKGSHAVYPRKGEFGVALSWLEKIKYVEPAGGGTSLWPQLHSGSLKRNANSEWYSLVHLPNLRSVSSGSPDSGHLLFSGAWVTGPSAHARIFPHMDRWYAAEQWADSGSNAWYPKGSACKRFAIPVEIDSGNATGEFNDVKKDDWHWVFVKKMADIGIINGIKDSAGKPTGDFAPDNKVNRAEFIKMLVLRISAAGLSLWDPHVEDPYLSGCFKHGCSDVSASSWYHDYVQVAAKNRVFGSQPCGPTGKFEPAKPIKRHEAARWIVRALGLSPSTNPYPFSGDMQPFTPDVQASVGYIVKAKECGIFDGYKDNSFGPADTLTRAQAAKILFGATIHYQNCK